MAKLIIPYANFAVTAMVLSDKHLRENIRDSQWLIGAIRGTYAGFRRHPLVLEWAEHLDAVRVLHDCCLRDLKWRGKRSLSTFRLGDGIGTPSLPGYSVPEFIGDFSYHARTRSQLMFVDPKWYGQWGWTDEPGRT